MKKVLVEFIVIFAIVFAFRSTILNWYVIPSGSLLPTLKIGDHVVVNKLSYGIMLPFMESRVYSWDHPKRGQIVVFQGPESEKKDLIKRVIGVAGDKVSFTNGVLTINGVLAHESLLSDRTPLQDMGGVENADDFNLFSESGFSNKPHMIMRKKWGSITEGESQSWVVPEHQLLLIGDNRDQSFDGRYWGFMDENRIYGRAFLIFYSTLNKPHSWIPSFRQDRWFSTITD